MWLIIFVELIIYKGTGSDPNFLFSCILKIDWFAK